MALLAVLALATVIAAAVLPYLAYLSRPDLPSVAGGLTILVCGLVLIRERAVGPVGLLLYSAGLFWFLPALDVTGIDAVDVAVRCTALVHLALLNHAVVVVGSPRAQGSIEVASVVSGYAAALTAVVGGYRVALPLLGVVVIATVLATRQRCAPGPRRWRQAAGLVLGGGLILDAALRWRTGIGAEAWVAVLHPAELAVTAVLVAVAGTRPSAWQSIEVRLDGSDTLTGIVAAQLGAPSVTLALSDGEGGWLRPTGQRRPEPTSPALAVADEAGRTVAVIEGDVRAAVPATVDHVLRMAAANARLRRSLVHHVEQLEASRRRLLSASDAERAALGASLRSRVIGSVEAIERELRRHPQLAAARIRATVSRQELERIARGIDPLASSGSLVNALADLAAGAGDHVFVHECEEPASPDVARALWFCCAEAAANTAKHAPKATLHIWVSRRDHQVTATLSDTGPGGAIPAGSGLRGLADRVETIGGRLTVRSPHDGGTTLTIVMPDGPRTVDSHGQRYRVAEMPPTGDRATIAVIHPPEG